MPDVKKDFPVFNRLVNGQPLVYLDSAATSQMPKQVIDAVARLDETSRANVHRGVHTLSIESSQLFDEARHTIAQFIGAKKDHEIIFTRNATEALNLVCYSWAEENIKAGDKIVTTIMEHHSNFVPWQQLAKKIDAELVVIGVTPEGILDLEGFEEKVKGAKLLALTHASNVLGTINPVKMLADMAHRAGAVVMVDGAQALPHIKVDVQELGADFYAFSGHKMLGPFGIGVLWAKEEHLEKMNPFNFGGDMIREVSVEESLWNELPYKFEAGTPNVSGAVGLGEAVKYLESFGTERVREHELNLLNSLMSRFTEQGITFYGPKNSELKTGVLAFNLDGVHPHDVAQILDSSGVAIRTGHHCAMPLHQFLKIDSSCRASLYIYNDEKDVDRLMEGLTKVTNVFSSSG